MIILEPHDIDTNWITAIIEDRYVVAKVFDEPSTYGINGGRISKLAILKTSTRDCSADWVSQVDYNYDRGLDFSNISNELLFKIIDELESLPKLYNWNIFLIRF